ncbi:MAG: tyrosine-type recombinase/integrase [Candidatus Diapherotrites archaeon]|nr:tyrosine-type recombinase/integrase [Candidatus Diapherotrites archaeon]
MQDTSREIKEAALVGEAGSAVPEQKAVFTEKEQRQARIKNPEFEVVLKELKQELIVEGYSSKTLKMYLLYCVESLYAINKSISSIEKKDIVGYLANKKEAGCSNATLSLVHASMEYMFGKHLKLKVLEDIKIPKKSKTLPKVLTKDEIRLLFENTHFGRNRLMLQFMYGSGCRVSEVVSMKIEELNFKEKTATIRGGKGNKDRMIILSKDWIHGVKKYLNRKKIKSEFVFSKKNGKRITTDTVQRIVRKAAAKAGINKHVTPHCLRHSYATHLLEAGTNIRYIQSLLGHSSLNTTQVYTNVANEQLKKVISPLDKL